MSRALRCADEARAAAAAGRWDRVEDLLRQAEAAQPRGTAWLQIALAWLDAGHAEEAAAALDHATQEDPSNPALWLFRALAHYDRGDMQAARSNLQEVRRLSPNNQALPTARALVMIGQDRVADALEILVPQEPSHERTDLSVSPVLLGRLALAAERVLLPLELPPAEVVEQATPPEPPAPGEAPAGGRMVGGLRAWRLQRGGHARLYGAWKSPHRREDLEEALRLLRQARDADPTAFRASYHVGEALLMAAEFGRSREEPMGPADVERVLEAEACFRRSIEEDSTNPYVLHYLARSLFLQRRFGEAIDEWRRALEGFEKFPEAHYGLGQAHLCRGEEREARHFLLQAIMSDLHLLRERFKEMDAMHRVKPVALEARPPLGPEVEPREVEPPAPEEPAAPPDQPLERLDPEAEPQTD